MPDSNIGKILLKSEEIATTTIVPIIAKATPVPINSKIRAMLLNPYMRKTLKRL